jgi:LPXTG-motif cell wall-anchored protein
MDTAQVLVAVGGALAIVGVLLFFFGPKRKNKPTA